MNTTPTQLLTEVEPLIGEIRVSLDRVEKTCCLPIRSKKMETVRSLVDQLQAAVDNFKTDQLTNYVQILEDAGAVFGTLYATCCNEKREPLFQSILRNLGKIHLKLYQAAGYHGH